MGRESIWTAVGVDKGVCVTVCTTVCEKVIESLSAVTHPHPRTFLVIPPLQHQFLRCVCVSEDIAIILPLLDLRE